MDLDKNFSNWNNCFTDTRIDSALEFTPMPINFWDTEFKNIYCNKEAVSFFELPNKNEYFEKYKYLSPEKQPDGQLSVEKRSELLKNALETGRVSFEWMHQTLSGKMLPAFVTILRIAIRDRHLLACITYNMRDFYNSLEKTRESEERSRIMLDIIPICCNFFDENMNVIDCNMEAINLFELSSKQEYLDRFYDISPKNQPDGSNSKEKFEFYIKRAFDEGRVNFEWFHQKLNGELIPSEITLVRVKSGDVNVLAGYTRDLREYRAYFDTINQMLEADERSRIMLNTAPLCVTYWDNHLNLVDCNQEAIYLFELSGKQEFIERFFELSPEYQPDGSESTKKTLEMVVSAFESGKVHFEWLHQKLDGEHIPSEVTLVRAKHKDGNIVVCYTRDLRELKNTVKLLKKIETLAYTDSLTGVYNRRYFMMEAQRAFSEFYENGDYISIVIFDLDRFKSVNDTYGHQAGDEILRQVCARAKTVLRDGDLLARYGGEEFIVLVNGGSNISMRLATRIRKSIASSVFLYEENEISVTISLGVAIKTDAETTLEETVRQADEALYKAKANGRNRVEHYDHL